MKLSKVIYYLIIIILLFAIYGSLELSINDFNQKNICPKLLGIPACYVVTLFFIIGIVTHIVQFNNKSKFIFYTFIGLVFLLALNGTLTELSGKEVCPRTAGGTPMCFISLGLCTSLLLLKFLMLRLESKITKNEINQ